VCVVSIRSIFFKSSRRKSYCFFGQSAAARLKSLRPCFLEMLSAHLQSDQQLPGVVFGVGVPAFWRPNRLLALCDPSYGMVCHVGVMRREASVESFCWPFVREILSKQLAKVVDRSIGQYYVSKFEFLFLFF